MTDKTNQWDYSNEEATDGSELTVVSENKQSTWSRYIGEFKAVFAVSLAFLYTGTTFGWLGPALLKLSSLDSIIKITDSEEPWVGGIIQLGAIPGSILGSIQADYFGRRKTILLLTFPFFLSSMILAFAQNIYHIYLSRIIAGYAMGVCYSVTSIYISEVSSPQIRGVLSIFSNMFINLGLLFQYCIGPFYSIQTTALITGIIPVIMFIFIWNIPESPYFYALKNRVEDVEESLIYLRGTYDVGEELDRIVCGTVREEKGLRELFRNPVARKVLIISSVLILAQQFTGSLPITSYTLELLARSNEAPAVTGIFLALLNFPMVFIIAFCVDIVGRRPLFIISSVLTMAALISFAIFFYLQERNPEAMVTFWYVPTLGFIGFRFAFGIGFEYLPYICASELFPTSFKGQGICVMSVLGALGGFLCFKMYHVLMTQFGLHWAFAAFSFFCLCSAVFVFISLPETRGRPLEDIQDELRTQIKRTNKTFWLES